MRFIIWERSVQKKTDFWIVLCCILKEPKINMLEFSCWCKKNSQSIHEELHSIPLIFLNKKSEIWNDFTIFEKWKVKNFLPSLFSRSESENQMTQNRDREVKVKIKWLKIEIEKWIFKKILENSRESRLSLVTVQWLAAPTHEYHTLCAQYGSFRPKAGIIWDQTFQSFHFIFLLKSSSCSFPFPFLIRTSGKGLTACLFRFLVTYILCKKNLVSTIHDLIFTKPK